MKIVLVAALVAALALPVYAAEKTDAERERCDAFAYAIKIEPGAASQFATQFSQSHDTRMSDIFGQDDSSVFSGDERAAVDAYQDARRKMIEAIWDFAKITSDTTSLLQECSGRPQ